MSSARADSPPSTQELLSAAPHALVQQFVLRVIEGPDAGASHTSAAARVVVGSDASADLALTDPTVSRFHCEIALRGGRAMVRDLGSRNGTVAGSISVLRAWLSDGAALTLGQSRVRFELGPGQARIPLSPRQRFGAMVGRSEAMRSVFAALERAAESDATVLIEGETGTGKEAAAEALHRESRRAKEPFIVVDCASLPPSLLMSELFGHERGAFTGAVSDRQGAFEAARGGTLFLDEIGELSPDLQPRLLRVLETREIKPIGRNRHVPVDVRVVAATNRDLYAEVNAQRLRPDLYYRLAVLRLRLPPLRERPEDIPLLIEHLLERFGAAAHPAAAALRSEASAAELSRHPWPGNVRELRNHVERCIALRGRAPLPAPAAASAPARLAPGAAPFAAARDAMERAYLEESLALHGDNVSAAARTAGLDRSQLHRLLWRHGLR